MINIYYLLIIKKTGKSIVKHDKLIYFYLFKKFSSFFKVFSLAGSINNQIYKPLNNYKMFFFKTFQSTSSSYSAIYWLSKYLGMYIKNTTNILVSWQFVNISLVNHAVNLLTVWKFTYKRYVLQKFYCSAWFYFYLLLQLYFFKSVDQLGSFISKIIQKQHIKQHKRLFQVVNTIFRYYFTYLSKKKKLKGYRIYFKGKLGRKGSVKKSVIYFNEGEISYTNKSLRYNYKYFLIPTETGVIGCYIGIFFIQMFTYIYIYIFFYFTIYIYFLIFFLNFFKVINIEKMYLVYLLNVLRKYNSKNPIPVLLFLLSGLPPVGLFFIKFNFLLTTLYNVSFFFQTLIFVNILLTMFFYLQVYNTNNSSQIISTKVVNLLKNNKVLVKNNFKYNNNLLAYYTKCLLFLFINFFSIFFFADIYLIIFNYNL